MRLTGTWAREPRWEVPLWTSSRLHGLADDVVSKVTTRLRNATTQNFVGGAHFAAQMGKPLSTDGDQIAFTVPRSEKYRPAFFSMAEPPCSGFLSALAGRFEKGLVLPSCSGQRITSTVFSSGERTRSTTCRARD